MKADEQDKRREAALRFVAKHYRSDALDPDGRGGVLQRHRESPP